MNEKDGIIKLMFLVLISYGSIFFISSANAQQLETVQAQEITSTWQQFP